MTRAIELDAKSLQRAMRHEQYVLLEIYAPWCPHCLNFAKDYDKVPTLVPNNVLVAKIDGTQHQPPTGVVLQYFPTFVLLSERFDKPLVFNGTRSVHGLVKFVTDALMLSS